MTNLPFDLNNNPSGDKDQGDIVQPEVVIETTIEAKAKVNLRELHPDKFLVSQSDMKHVLKQGNEIDHCARRIMEIVIIRQYKTKETLSMKKGSYFETLLLGSGAGGKLTIDLPRKKMTDKAIRELVAKGTPTNKIIGEKTIDQIRIEDQAIRASQRMNQLKITLTENNVQVPLITHVFDNVYFIGELDLFPVTILTEEGLFLSIVDLKLTADVHSKFGDYCWGAPEYMDHSQAIAYQYMVQNLDYDLNPHIKILEEERPGLLKMAREGNVAFFYWVFGYSKLPADAQEKIIRVTYDELKRKEFIESVRKYVGIITMYANMGDKIPTNPKYEHCNDCPVSSLNGGYCTEAKTIQTI